MSEQERDIILETLQVAKDLDSLALARTYALGLQDTGQKDTEVAITYALIAIAEELRAIRDLVDELAGREYYRDEVRVGHD